MGADIVIALDAMGGDRAPEAVLRGATIALQRFPQARFVLYGDEGRLAPALAKLERLKERATIGHTDEAVANDQRPSVALRAGKRSSMRLAIDAVAAGTAHCVVSAGNTGALMAMAKFGMRMLPGIDRPAMASFFPTARGESVLLDLGANVDCDADNLVQFALMGDVFARTVLGLVHPTVGLLNVGSEDVKGNDAVRGAALRLRAPGMPIRFEGFIEGDGIAAGAADVIVTDGFTGNIALKTAEGTARLFADFLRASFQNSLSGRIGYLFAHRALRKLRSRLDPRRYNGAVFLGLDGICVKSHGSADALGFANAVGVAVDMKVNGFLEKIRDGLAQLSEASAPQDKSQSAAL